MRCTDVVGGSPARQALISASQYASSPSPASSSALYGTGCAQKPASGLLSPMTPAEAEAEAEAAAAAASEACDERRRRKFEPLLLRGCRSPSSIVVGESGAAGGVLGGEEGGRREEGG